MKYERTYPNVLWILFATIPCLFIIWFSVSILVVLLHIQVPFLLQPKGEAEPLEVEVLLMTVVMMTAFILLGVKGLISISRNCCWVIVRNEQLLITYPFKLRRKKVLLRHIRAYTTSQYCIGKRDFDSSALWCSDSVVIYTVADEVFEVVKLYHWNFKMVERVLQAANTHNYGFESYKWKGWFFKRRVYSHWLNNRE